MRTLRIAVTVAALFTLAGCWVLSIEPLYTNEDLVFEPALVGVWGDPAEEAEETWTFTQHGDRSYSLTIEEEGAPDATFEAHLLRLNNRLYLDLLPDEPEAISEALLGHLIPAHSFWTVSLEGNLLSLDVISADWLREMIDSAKVNIDHIRRDHAIVLTAHTKDLQDLVIKHIDEAVTGEPFVMKRVR